MDGQRITLPDELQGTGYGREEEYFFHENQELANELHRRQAQAKAEEDDKQRRVLCRTHCPDCGGTLAATLICGQNAEACPSCGGAFFSKTSLEALQEPGVKQALGRWLRRSLAKMGAPQPTGIGQFPV